MRAAARWPPRSSTATQPDGRACSPPGASRPTPSTRACSRRWPSAGSTSRRRSRSGSRTRPSAKRTSSSRWAVATPAPSTRASGTRTGSFPIPPGRASTRSVSSGTRSTAACGPCWRRWARRGPAATLRVCRVVRRTSKAAACYRFTVPLSVRHILGALLAFGTLAGPAAADTGIVAIGDFGVGGDRERATGAAVERFAATRPAAALVTLGDNDYTERPAAFRRNWRSAFGWAAEGGLLVAGTLGNHDVRVDGGRYEFGPLGMPGRYYRRRVGDVALFLLDSTNLGPAQLRWLDGALGRTDAPWKVVAFHHPPFSCGGVPRDQAGGGGPLPPLSG